MSSRLSFKFYSSNFLNDPIISENHSTCVHSGCQIKKRRNSFNTAKVNSMFSKSQPEEVLRKLLFSDNPMLLYSYCDKVLKNGSDEKRVIPFLIFYSSRGKITQLLCQVGKREIKEAKAGTPLFRGNTPFIRFYSFYLFFYCNEYLTKTTSAIIKQIENGEQQMPDSNNQVYTKQFVTSYSRFITESIPYIPCHQRKVIKSLLSSPSVINDTTKKKQIFSTLMFLRYLFVPFLKHPCILKLLQKCVSEWIRECEDKDKKQVNTTDVFNELKLSLDYLYDNVVNSPVGFEVGMINLKQQERSLNELILLLKDNLFTLSSDYNGDFQEIFNLVKGKQEIDNSANMKFATDELKHWTGSKLEIASQLNCELKFKITELTRENERIKHRISFINNYFL
ncbi:hypothetical protein ENUP19_0279G0002 [Entamoeba nuttalli]|uniref:Ras-GAP domain-containing protein n=2 Tax=Entamoeba nuttalli TaxID=412467 RepID=A0ABQ0DTP0_9EUKA